MTDIPTDETSNLISAEKVQGTAVYNAEGESIGDVHDVILNKRSGQVAYAILSFGGFLGMGENYHPIPWDALRYDLDQDGYVINMDKDQLKEAPQISADETDRLHDRPFEEEIHTYYGVPPYWM